MKNKLGDLNNHLFAALERLGDEDMKADDIEREAKRSAAIVGVANMIISNADTQLKAAKLYAEHGHSIMPMLPKVGGAAAEIEGKAQ
jgi:hypothetical protein